MRATLRQEIQKQQPILLKTFFAIQQNNWGESKNYYVDSFYWQIEDQTFHWSNTFLSIL